MEAKFLASVFSFLSIFLAIYAQSPDEKVDFEKYDTVIYYGDLEVKLGEPFSITCIIPISTRVNWTKDGEPITRHNLRHGRDEHSYVLTESDIEGERHKTEAHISVKHALKVHEGKYQCNGSHSSFHMLHVHVPIKTSIKPPIRMGNYENELATESGYKTIDLTPHSSNGEAEENSENLFARTWDQLPTQSTPVTTHHRSHQRHHQSTKKENREREKDNLLYINATNVDGNPRILSASGSHEYGDFNNMKYMPSTPPRYTEMTTVPLRPSTSRGSTGEMGLGSRPVHIEHGPPPRLPPPRTIMSVTTTGPEAGQYYTSVQTDDGRQYYVPGSHHNIHAHMHLTTANPAAVATINNVRFPPQTEQSQPPFYYQSTYQSGPDWSYPTTEMPYTPYIPHNLPPYQQIELSQHQQQQQHYTKHHKQQAHQLPHAHTPAVLFKTSSAVTSPYAPLLTTLSSASLRPNSITPVKKELDFLVPNYDNVEHQLKVFDIKMPLVLFCNVTKEGDYEMKWEKNGTDVTKVKQLEGRYRIIAPERKFLIDRTEPADDGLYSCVVNNQKKDFNVIARVVVRVPSNTGVVEGEKLSIVCTVAGTDPQLSWVIGNTTLLNSTDRFVLKPDDNQIQNAVLTVENISLDDRGEFKCVGRNAANDYANYPEASDVSYVRVKGKLAALWPFLGICAEVFILCTIILIYEKRRNKTELEESDTDPQEQKKKRRNYD